MIVSVVAIPALVVFLLFCCPCWNSTTDRDDRSRSRPAAQLMNAGAAICVATAPAMLASRHLQPRPQQQTHGRAEPYPEPTVTTADVYTINFDFGRRHPSDEASSETLSTLV